MMKNYKALKADAPAKLKFYKSLYVLPITAIFIAMIGCSSPSTSSVTPEPKKPVTGITVTRGGVAVGSTLRINVDQEINLAVELEPIGVSGAIVTWSKTSSSVALTRSEDGLSVTVKGVTAGRSSVFTVTASNADNDEPVTKVFTVTVNSSPKYPVTGITVTREGVDVGSTLSVNVDQEITLDVELEPVEVNGAIVTWSKTSSSVALTCSDDGLSATVKGVTAGGSSTFTVTASNADNDEPVTKVFTVTVNSSVDPEDPDDPPVPPLPHKYEFRGVWVATVTGDVSGAPFSENSFRTMFTNILNTCEAWNMNAVIFQVSPMLDAWYPSTINPWSQYLTGKQGAGTIPSGWDPLAIMVEETHKRGMEFHAWFNPYRVTSAAYGSSTVSKPGGGNYTQAELDAMPEAELLNAYRDAGILAPNNWAVLNPDKVYLCERRIYLDAGHPDVRRHVADTAKEVVENYDVDAIHYDDYFYPYTWTYASHRTIDQATFEQYGDGYAATQADREQWWRDNNTKFVQEVKAVIEAENQRSNKAIQLGISPFAVWASNTTATVPPGTGSPTGNTQFTYTGGVYADTRKWVVEELVDYMLPQIYWERSAYSNLYEKLVLWWDNVHQNKNVHFYVGHANYKQLNNYDSEPNWRNADEIYEQLLINKEYPQVKGSAFFSYQYIARTTGSTDAQQVMVASNAKVKTYWGQYKTIVPPKTWLKDTAPDAPSTVRQNNKTITWSDAAANDVRYYVVYRALTEDGITGNKIRSDPANIISRVGRVNAQTAFTFTDTAANPGDYTYVVTAFNAAHIESNPRIAVKQ
jgi:uncharacterized lipoprotein YddW (UPF0748 family)